MSVSVEEESMNIEEEYNNTLRTQSNACFLSAEEQYGEGMEVALLDTEDFISPVLHNMMVRRRTSAEIKLAVADYFDASSEASEMCRQLLRNIKSTQSNYRSMDNFLASMSDGAASTSASQPVRSNPFCTTTRGNFRRLHDRYSSILQSIKSSHRKVARRLKIVKAIKKRSSKTTASLLRLRDQLDAAAKGSYVLGMDIDTVSQLVARLSDGIERENTLARWCAERAGERCSVQEMVRELRRSCSTSRRLAEELEEQVCLCLATIHRARVLVIQDVPTQE